MVPVARAEQDARDYEGPATADLAAWLRRPARLWRPLSQDQTVPQELQAASANLSPAVSTGLHQPRSLVPGPSWRRPGRGRGQVEGWPSWHRPSRPAVQADHRTP